MGDLLGRVAGPVWDANEYTGDMMTTTSRKCELSSDAADKGVHALEMRYVDLVCGTRRQKPHIWPSDGIGRRA